MTHPLDPLRHVVIRACDASGLNELGGAIAPEALRRPITFRINRGGLNADQHTTDGLVLIGNDDLEPTARHVGHIVLKIMRTPELLWMPVNASREFGAWRIEAAPLVDYLRLTSRTDETLCRASHIDPTTGHPIGQEPPR